MYEKVEEGSIHCIFHTGQLLLQFYVYCVCLLQVLLGLIWLFLFLAVALQATDWPRRINWHGKSIAPLARIQIVTVQDND